MTPTIPYGGDCNPEQWPEQVGGEDHRLFTEARIDTLTVGVFSWSLTWSLTRPAPGAHDFTSWGSYPPLDAPPTRPALAHDLVRGLKDGAPFRLMEQTPSTAARRDVNPLRRPGEPRLATFQAIAHGADAAL